MKGKEPLLKNGMLPYMLAASRTVRVSMDGAVANMREALSAIDAAKPFVQNNDAANALAQLDAAVAALSKPMVEEDAKLMPPGLTREAAKRYGLSKRFVAKRMGYNEVAPSLFEAQTNPREAQAN